MSTTTSLTQVWPGTTTLSIVSNPWFDIWLLMYVDQLRVYHKIYYVNKAYNYKLWLKKVSHNYIRIAGITMG